MTAGNGHRGIASNYLLAQIMHQYMSTACVKFRVNWLEETDLSHFNVGVPPVEDDHFLTLRPLKKYKEVLPQSGFRASYAPIYTQCL